MSSRFELGSVKNPALHEWFHSNLMPSPQRKHLRAKKLPAGEPAVLKRTRDLVKTKSAYDLATGAAAAGCGELLAGA